MGKVATEWSRAVMTKLSAGVHWNKLEKEVVQKIIGDPRACREFEKFLQNGATVHVPVILPTFPVEVPKVSLADAIKAGKYDYVGDVDEGRFPSSDSDWGKKEIVLFRFNRISGAVAIAEMNKEGYRPATLRELLALGAKYYPLQWAYEIVALGSVWYERQEKYRHMTKLYYVRDVGRCLGTGNFKCEYTYSWFFCALFAAVCK